MNPDNGAVQIETSVFLEIIRTQTDVARLGIDVGGVMQLVSDRLLGLTAANAVIVELAEGDEMVYRAAAGIARNQLGLRISRVRSLSGQCLALGELLVCEDTEVDPRVDREATRRVGVRSMAVAPLAHDGAAVGVLKIASAEAGGIGRTDVEILRLMSGMLGPVLFHAASHEADVLYVKATRDPLTGLANRALFYDRLRQSLGRAAREGSRVGLLNLDMDNLKAINDRHGHRAGDAALRELSQRLGRALRSSDTPARVGGDEFGVILPDVEGRTAARAARMRIQRDMRAAFTFEDQALRVQASIGAAIYPDDASDVDDLLEAADRAMYAVKRRRRARAAQALQEVGTPPSPGA